MILRELKARNEREWHANRRCGASSVAAILGISPYKGPWDVYHNARSPKTAEQRRGHQWEPIVLHLYREETGNQVSRPGRWSTYVGPEGWASSSPDAFVLDEVEGLAEAKTDMQGEYLWGSSQIVNNWDEVADALEAGEPLVRPDYALQCQWQAWCLDAPWVDLAVLLPRYELRVFRIVRDDALLEDVVPQVREWWERHIIHGYPPPVDSSEGFRSWYAAQPARAEVLEAIPPVEQLVLRWASAADEYRAAKDRRDELAAAVAATVGPYSGLRLSDGRECRMQRREGVTSVDMKALREAHPELVPVIQQFTRQGDPFAFPQMTKGGKPRRKHVTV